MKTTVGVSELRVSMNVKEIIVTYALGSCLGIALYDPVVKAGGLLHVMLPHSKVDPEKARLQPAKYVDTGFPKLLQECYKMGARKENLKIVVAGGASMKSLGKDDYFKIGKRNFTMLRKLLWKNGFMIHQQDVGGHISRTMALHISNGLVTINKKPIEGENGDSIQGSAARVRVRG